MTASQAEKGPAKPRRRGVGRETAKGSPSTLRARLDEIDTEVLALLGERHRTVAEVRRAEKPRANGQWGPGRERAQLARLEALNRAAGSPLEPVAVRAIFGEVLAASRALDGPLSVAYLGPPGTFSERAAREQFGNSAELVPSLSIGAVFRAVERGEARLGIVPIENSTEGMVGPTLDAFVQSPLEIVAERELRIRHALLANSRRIREVRRIVSHPQSFAQCREWLAREMPSVPTMEVASNALAAETAARSKTTAAIAGREAAERYGLRVLADNIQDLPRNVTRFVVIAPAGSMPAGGEEKVSVLFSVRNEPGSLFRALRPFARYKIDLHKLESRPMRGRPWEYLFFVDLRGDVASPGVKRAMAAMARECVWFRVLGAYSGERVP